MPILLICPSNNLGDAEAALRAGANDFVTEFAPPAEVAARVRSLNRTPVREVRRGRARDIRLDWGTRSVRVGRASVVLAPMEFAVLECLLRHAGKAVKREVLLAEVWAPDATCTSNRPDVYMHYLRRKLSSVGLGDAIRTMRGTGYVLQLE